MTKTEDILAQIKELPAQELGKVTDFCVSLLTKASDSEAQETDPLEDFLSAMSQIEINGDSVQGDPRLQYLLDKHGSQI